MMVLHCLLHYFFSDWYCAVRLIYSPCRSSWDWDFIAKVFLFYTQDFLYFLRECKIFDRFGGRCSQLRGRFGLKAFVGDNFYELLQISQVHNQRLRDWLVERNVTLKTSCEKYIITSSQSLGPLLDDALRLWFDGGSGSARIFLARWQLEGDFSWIGATLKPRQRQSDTKKFRDNRPRRMVTILRATAYVNHNVAKWLEE